MLKLQIHKSLQRKQITSVRKSLNKMTEFDKTILALLETILERLDYIESEIKKLKIQKTLAQLTIEQVEYFENLPPSSVVGKD